jgi:CP family cyanate transporter-like MFS transporter
VLLALVAWVALVPRRAEGATGSATRGATLAADLPPPRRADLRSWRVWQASLVLGSGSLLFFGMDTWIPVFYAHRGYSDGPLALTVLTVAQLPASLALTAWGHHVAGRRIGFVTAGGVATVALGALFIAPSSWYLALFGITGAASAGIFVLGLSLPNYLTTGPEVARVSGIMLGISYTLAFVGPFLGGVLWDATHIDMTAFVPILLGGVAVLILGAFMPDLRR